MAEMVERPSWQKGVAEFVGTLTLIYVGVLVITIGIPSGAGITGVALAHGLAIAVMVSATMSISGGQLNPAVTIGLLVGKKISPAQAGVNVIAQLVGGLAGGYLAKVSLPVGLAMGGVPDLAPSISLMQGIVIEATLTFFLVFVVFGTGVDPRFGARIGGLAIGLTVAMDILAGGALTGAAMNPARWFGAAIPAAHTANAIVYIVGPILGGILAAVVYTMLLEPKPHPEPQAQMRAKDNP